MLSSAFSIWASSRDSKLAICDRSSACSVAIAASISSPTVCSCCDRSMLMSPASARRSASRRPRSRFSVSFTNSLRFITASPPVLFSTLAACLLFCVIQSPYYRPHAWSVAYKMDHSLSAHLLRRLPGWRLVETSLPLAAHGPHHLDARLSPVRRACGLRVPLLSPVEPRDRVAFHGRAHEAACRR